MQTSTRAPRPDASASTAAPRLGPSSLEVFSYDDQIVRMFVLATVLWGFIGMAVGALLALQLPF